jgi:hypothetical protein
MKSIDVLSLFKGRCGHQWVGATNGSFACPVCGDHEGDHHLRSIDPIPVQIDDWGCGVWRVLGRASSRKCLSN